jgi:hypothetical protein
METYNGDETNGRTVSTSTPATFAAPETVDVHTWATLAASYNKFDFAILTVSHIYGFSLYDHQSAVWSGSQIDVGGGIIVPTYTKYDVGATGCNADKNIVTKFISEFNAVNIKPFLYYCVGWARNWGGQKFIWDQYTEPNYQFAFYHTYVIARLKELAALNPFGIWIDVDCYYAPGYQQALYNAIKEVNPNIFVEVNVAANQVRIENSYGLFDGASVEEFIAPATGNDWWTKTQVKNAVTYPCSKELCGASRQSNTWFYKAIPTALRTSGQVQTLYDAAKAKGVPLAISINPKLDGIIDQTQADLIGGITL